MKWNIYIVRCLAFWLLICLGITPASAQPVPVFIEAGATTGEQTALNDLITYLGKATKASFQPDSINVFRGKGIYLTTVSADKFKKAPAALKQMGEEGVYVSGTKDYIYIVGNSSLGLQHGIYLYLHKLGFRFYFPSSVWHIVPVLKSVFVPLTILEKPDFPQRSIFMGWGFGNDDLKKDFEFWNRANLMGGAMKVNFGHAYGNIFLDNKAFFDIRPRALTKSLVNGKIQPNTAFNFADAELGDIVYKWLARNFDNADKRGTPLQMISLEPFDGSNFCDMQECLKIGTTTSDQLYYFTNRIARKLKISHPGKKIGLLAYYDHVDIPSKYGVEDNIFVTLANGYNPTSYTTDELIGRWRTKVKDLGIYDYYAVYAGSSAELPGKDRGGNYRNVAADLVKFKKAGIISFQAESTNGWIAKGLTHYVTARLTWNSRQNVNAIADDFFSTCFPASSHVIKSMFEDWNRKSAKTIITDDDLYQWFSSLRSALNLASAPAEVERLKEIALYLFYVRMHQDYLLNSRTPAGKEKLERLSAYLWELLPTGITPSYAALNVIPRQLEAGNEFTSKSASWKSIRIDHPENRKEWLSYISAYLPSLKRIQAIRTFNTPPFLTPAELRQVPAKSNWVTPKRNFAFSGAVTAIIDTRGVKKDSLIFRFQGGTYKKSGNIKAEVYPYTPSFIPTGQPIRQFAYPADGNQRTVSLKDLQPARYLVIFRDANTLGSIYFSESMKFSFLASPDVPVQGGSFNSFYFYVPPGTDRFYIAKDELLMVYNPHQKLLQSPMPEKLMELKPAPDESGWWKVHIQRGEFQLIGVPPLISRDPASFLFPER